MIQYEKPHIWIDADSCPAQARDIVLKAAAKEELLVTYAANRPLAFSLQNPLFTMHVCPSTPGAADDYIVEHASEWDIVITRDIPLAARLVEKNICVINDRGIRFDKDNIAKRLKERELSMQMEALGLHKGKGHIPYGGKEIKAFNECFQRVLAEKLYPFR